MFVYPTTRLKTRRHLKLAVIKHSLNITSNSEFDLAVYVGQAGP